MQKICIIIPCYNEEQRLDVKTFSEFAALNRSMLLLFVNDGSKDDTWKVITGMLNESNIFGLNLKSNGGKAEAVRQGVLYAIRQFDIDWVGYWDADLATPLYEINAMHEKISSSQHIDLLLASRIKRMGAKVDRTAKRHLLGRVLSSFVSIILKLPIYDSQCGAKFIRANLVSRLFEAPFISRWLFDIEIIARYRNEVGIKQTLASVSEYPVNVWEEKSDSKIKFSHMMNIPFELFRISAKYNGKRSK